MPYALSEANSTPALLGQVNESVAKGAFFAFVVIFFFARASKAWLSKWKAEEKVIGAYFGPQGRRDIGAAFEKEFK